MGLFRFAPAQQRNPSPDALIRVFQSETGEVREDPEPAQLRWTLYGLAVLLAAMLAVSVFMQMDRVITSSAGQIVTTEPTIVLQALDASIIKSLDMQEGERVKRGQLLATLDPTFASADVSAATLQIASLEAQIARTEAELAHRSFDPPAGTTPEAAYMALQKAYYVQRKVSSRRSCAPMTSRSRRTRRRSASSKTTSPTMTAGSRFRRRSRACGRAWRRASSAVASIC
jgi:hemolysin D